MKKSIADYKERALKNMSKIRGGGDDGAIDRDKVKTPRKAR